MKAILQGAFVLSFLSFATPAQAQGAGAPSAELADESAVLEAAGAVEVDDEASDLQGTGGLTVEGAPLGNQNVHVHIVEKKPHADQGRHELALYPATAQINTRYTWHMGAAATYSYHLFENLALTATPLFNYVNRNTDYNYEILTKGQQQPSAATTLLLQYGALGGVEITPIYGKFALYDGLLGQFSFVIQAGVGVGMTQVQINPDSTANPEYGAVGPKLMGNLGAGFRVLLGESWALRLEVRDFLYSATVDKINGCNYGQLSRLAAGGGGSSIGGGCRIGDFKGQGQELDIRFKRAKGIVGAASSDVVNNVTFFGGVSYLF